MSHRNLKYRFRAESPPGDPPDPEYPEPVPLRVLRPDGTELTPEASLKVRNHSPTGFEWGYAGSGPAQLALALALDVALRRGFESPVAAAEAVYFEVKDRYVKRAPPRMDWTLAEDAIGEILASWALGRLL